MPNKPPIEKGRGSGGNNLAAIYHVLLRSKWLILTFSLAGLVAAVAIYLQTPRTYVSEAKLLIRYVLERKAVDPLSAGEEMRFPDAGGYNIINTEMEILSSLDLARQVAEMIGPEKILPEDSRNPSAASAAVYINKNLQLASERQSSVIKLFFEHPDPETAHTILQQLIEVYLKKHMEIHRSPDHLLDYLSQQRDKYRAELSRTDEELSMLRNKVGLGSVEHSRTDLLAQNSRIKQELLIAEVELAEHSALFKQFETVGTSKPPTTNFVVPPEVPPAVVEEYRTLIKKNRQLIVDTDKELAKMEEAHPGLKFLQMQTATEPTDKRVDLVGESARIVALQAKMAVQTNQLEQVWRKLAAIEQVEPAIEQMQARRTKTEASLGAYQTALDRLAMEMRGGGGAMSNIALLQEASIASLVRSRSIKLAAMASFCGIGGGISLALLIGICTSPRRALPSTGKSEEP